MTNPGDFQISLNGSVTNSTLADDIERRELLQTLASYKDADFSIKHERGPVLTVLFNTQRAFVMWLEEEGDQGQHATDPDADAIDGQQFVLSNGQVDQFSNYDTVNRDLTLEAISHFIETRLPSPQLHWAVP